MSDFARRLVWETEGREGAAERGWLGEEERHAEEMRQAEEHALQACHASLDEISNALEGVVATGAGGFTGHPYVDGINTLKAERDALRAELMHIRSEYSAANSSDLTRDALALKCAALEAECYQALCNWQEQQDKIESLQAEVTASNNTIDMLYQRTGRFSAQADRYEQALQLIANRDCRVGCKERRVVQCATCLAKHTLGLL